MLYDGWHLQIKLVMSVHACFRFMLNLTGPARQTRLRDETYQLRNLLEQILDRIPQPTARPAALAPAADTSLLVSCNETAAAESSKPQVEATRPASQRTATTTDRDGACDLPTAPVSRRPWLELAVAVAASADVTPGRACKNDSESREAAAVVPEISRAAAGGTSCADNCGNDGSGFDCEARHVSVPPGMAFLIDPGPVPSKLLKAASPNRPHPSISLNGTPSHPKPGAIGRNPCHVKNNGPESPAAASLSRRSNTPAPAPATLSTAPPYWREPWSMGESPASKASRTEYGGGGGIVAGLLPDSLEGWLQSTMGGLGLVGQNRALSGPGGEGGGGSNSK